MFSKNSDPQFSKIEQTLNHYFNGYLNAEAEVLSKAFHQDSKLFTMEEGKLSKTELSSWISNLRERKAKGDIRTAEVEILGMDVTGDSAVAKVCLKFPQFAFVDYLSLLKEDGRWIIINKIYSVQ